MSADFCKTCGKTIVWAISPSGANIPLQPVPGYLVEVGASGMPCAARTDAPVYISHFLTCPQASQHSKKGKKA